MIFSKTNKVRLFLGNIKLILFLSALIFMILGAVLTSYSESLTILKVIASTSIIISTWSFLGLLYGINQREYELTKEPEPGSFAATSPFAKIIASSIEFVIHVVTFTLFFLTPIIIIYFILFK